MKHLGTKTLETNRLILRPFVREDARPMYRNWASEEEVTRFLTWPTHTDLQVTEMVVSDWVTHYGDDNYYQWAIGLKDLDGEAIGSIAVVSMDEAVQKVQLGYCIGSAWWRQGIMSEALQTVIDYLFGQVGVRRIEAVHDVQNPHSGAVMKKCGMVREGIIRQSERNNQGICDAVWYGILMEDWMKLRAEKSIL